MSVSFQHGKDCVSYSAIGAAAFETTKTKLYVLVLTLSTRDSKKLLKQLFKNRKQIDK